MFLLNIIILERINGSIHPIYDPRNLYAMMNRFEQGGNINLTH